MSGGRIHLTREGYEKIRNEHEELIRRRKDIAKDIERARAFGDLRENAEYDAAKNAQAMNEKRICELSDTLSRASILDEEGMDKDKILLGATATLFDEEMDEEIRYTFVSAEEADFEANKISIASPIGRTLLGHKVGDVVEVQVPAGVLRYVVRQIER
ncbi:MAG: transcription elongation factor GreA [Candidatus Omnitrophica bacterium]|nr:transcription elongation factor GreA [Candidatus Omnitrophota bacterium]